VIITTLEQAVQHVLAQNALPSDGRDVFVGRDGTILQVPENLDGPWNPGLDGFKVARGNDGKPYARSVWAGDE
jgi:hypothetical protein